jgi:hypothetical protein
VGTWRYWSSVFVYGGTVDSGPADYYRSLFEAVPVEIVARDDGPADPRYRLEGTLRHQETDLEALAGADQRDLDVSATVDGSGLIRRHDLTYAADFDGDPGRVRRSLEYADVGETTVTRPIWAD